MPPVVLPDMSLLSSLVWWTESPPRFDTKANDNQRTSPRQELRIVRCTNATVTKHVQGCTLTIGRTIATPPTGQGRLDGFQGHQRRQ